MMAILPYFTVACAVVCCGMARLKGGADHFWRGEGNYMSSQRDKQWWSDISASLTSAVPGNLLFTPRSRGASSQSGNVELKGSWWFSLELQKCNLSTCGRPVEHQSRPPFDPQPAWQSGVGTTWYNSAGPTTRTSSLSQARAHVSGVQTARQTSRSME
jgi:hypothetical protein